VFGAGGGAPALTVPTWAQAKEKKMSLYQSFKTHASLSGVSHGTREAHEVAFRDFAQWAKSEANIQIKSIDNLKVKHIEAYTKSRLNNGIKPRTLQNRMAALRVAMRNSEKEHIRALANPKHSQLSCKALGIDGASREGTKTAMSDDMLKGAIERLENGSGRALAGLTQQRLCGSRQPLDYASWKL